MNLSIKPELKFLFIFIFIFISCSKENPTIVVEKPTTNSSKPPLTDFKMLHKSEAFLSEKNQIKKELRSVRKKLGGTLNSIEGKQVSSKEFKIYTDNITYVYSPEDSTETYAFYIEYKFQRNNYIIENLILKKKSGDSKFRAYVIEYYLKNGLSSSKENLEVVNFKEIGVDQLNGVSNKCSNTYESYVVEVEHDCGSGDHSGAGDYASCELTGSSKPYSTYEINVIVNGCGSGGGGGLPGPGDPEDEGGPGGGGSDSGGANDNLDTGMSLPPSCQTEDCAEEDILANQINDKLDSSLSYQELLWMYNNTPKAQQLMTFLNNISAVEMEEAKAFAKEAIKAWMNDGEVDFDERIINEDSFNDEPCFKDNLDQLSTIDIAQDYFNNFEGESPVAHLKFTASSFGNNINAITYPPENFVIEIEFNTDKTSRPKSDIARTIMHEVIHAEIFRKLLSLAKAGDLSGLTEQDIKDAKDSYPGIYDYYTRYFYDNPNPSSPQHDMMAEHLIGTLITSLMQFDSSLSNAQAEALAWTGLKKGVNGDSNSEINSVTGLVVDPITGANESTVAWTNLTEAERLSINQTSKNYMQNTPPCQ